MENIFNKQIISRYYFANFSINIKYDLFDYLDDNLDKENIETFFWDLKTALTNNANGEYI
jgi:transcriptional accessory protein Tex/SPT6